MEAVKPSITLLPKTKHSAVLILAYTKLESNYMHVRHIQDKHTISESKESLANACSTLFQKDSISRMFITAKQS